ncbi:MAG TPA: hypothetical protein VMU92_09165 [Acidobacteriaceae bacterium]|nr:hypothetical protein [Acidobacteriaceae bacterium]
MAKAAQVRAAYNSNSSGLSRIYGIHFPLSPSRISSSTSLSWSVSRLSDALLIASALLVMVTVEQRPAQRWIRKLIKP